jgi:nitrite reductase/ring-hydroxylating ferredoxin subunit
MRRSNNPRPPRAPGDRMSDHEQPASALNPSPSEDPRLVSRRWLLFKASIGLNALIGAVLAVPVVRYLLAPWRKDSSYDSWVSVGSLDSFPSGETRLAIYKNPSTNSWDGETDNVACYVRRESTNQFRVFAINCAHLGCPVRWFPQSQLFMCPCHGGVYYADGSRASGPPERGLFTYNWRIASGQLEINAGQMPTLSNTARLVKIWPAPDSPPSTSAATPANPGDCSCQG